MMAKPARFFFIPLLAILLAGYGIAVMAQQQPIIFSDLAWDTARAQNRIAQYMVEKGYGYPTDVLSGSMTGLFQALRQGETDVMMEFWLSTNTQNWQKAAIAGEVVSLGVNVGGILQSAFMIPAYVQEAHPELDSIEDLKQEQYQRLFAASDSGGKARLMTCPTSWACHDINQMQIAGYGLAEHIHVAVPESEAALNSDLFDLYAKEAPWLGYLDDSMATAIKLDMVQLAEPPHSALCWATTKACAYDRARILIAARPALLERAPEVTRMLRAWTLNAALYSDLSLQGTDRGASHADIAIGWLNENEAVWSQWVTEEAAIAIREALDRGERAEGWPDE